MRRLVAVVLTMVGLTALGGVILVPAIHARSATTGACDAGSECGTEYISPSCLALGFGETYNSFPGYGYQFVASGC